MKHDPNYTLIHPTDYHCHITPFLPSPTETISDKFQFGYEKKTHYCWESSIVNLTVHSLGVCTFHVFQNYIHVTYPFSL